MCRWRGESRRLAQRNKDRLVTERYRMTLREGENWGELYDLVTDPAEIHNHFDKPEAVEVRRELTEQILKRVIALQDRAPLPAFRARRFRHKENLCFDR